MTRSAQARRVAEVEMQYNNHVLTVERERANKKRLKKELKRQLTVLDLFQQVAQEVQDKAHQSISSVVSKCLSIVFDTPYVFTIVFELKRSKTEARLVFCRDGNEVDPMTSSGGGVVDVAAFALRMACMMLKTPPVERVVVLDEPFRFVSESYQKNVKAMIHYLSDELEIQFIYVTHNERLVTGNVIEIA